MNIFWAFILGTLQGLTEFFPISSSGHLVIAQNLIPNFAQPGVLFDVVLHAGTLCAILIYFRKRILKLTRSYVGLIIIGTIPAALLGFFFQSILESLFENLTVVGFALLLTGGMNWLVDSNNGRKRGLGLELPLSKRGIKAVIFIGLAQAIAIVPGISRSGSTIFAGTRVGLSKKNAAEFSFLLSVPAVIGANISQIVSHSGSFEIDIIQYLVGFLSAAMFGYFAISWVMKILGAKKFRVFAYYCFILGAIVLLFL